MSRASCRHLLSSIRKYISIPLAAHSAFFIFGDRAAGIANGDRATKLQSEASRTPRRRLQAAQLRRQRRKETQKDGGREGTKKSGRAAPIFIV